MVLLLENLHDYGIQGVRAGPILPIIIIKQLLSIAAKL